jgi:hypothetical protein
MTFRSHRLTLAALITLLGLGAGLPALADPQYPNKPIRLVIGYAPGGSVDMAGRVVADMLSSKLGATVVVENQPGAAGTIAAQRVVSSAPDGYTLLAGSSNELAGTGQVNPAQKYDPLKDLTPVALVGTAPVVLVASPKHNVKNLDQFLALVKSKPGRFSYGSSGVGSTLHFAGELIKQRAGLFMTHIPYRGTAPLIWWAAPSTLRSCRPLRLRPSSKTTASSVWASPRRSVSQPCRKFLPWVSTPLSKAINSAAGSLWQARAACPSRLHSACAQPCKPACRSRVFANVWSKAAASRPAARKIC